MFEHRRHRLLTRREFAQRWAKWASAAVGVIVFSLFVGAAGYRVWAGVDRWVDAVHDAAMILTGMGPAYDVPTDAGKIFETLYAIFSGVVFISVAGMLLGPPAHRVLHRFHLDDDAEDTENPSARRERNARAARDPRARREPR